MKKILFTYLIFGLFVGEIKAQDTLRLTFQEAVEIGLRQNLNYRTLNNQQEVLKIENQAARMGHLPRLNASNSFFRQSGQQYQQVEDQLIVTNLTNNSISSSVNMTMPVFNGGRRINMTRATGFFKEAGENEMERAAQEMMFTVSQQYLQVLLDEELYRIAQENLANQKKLLEQIDGFVEAGLRTLSDQYNQQSEVARLETVALNAKIQWETDAWTLAETLQLDSNTIPKLEGISLTPSRSEYLSMPLEELYDLSIGQRKDFKQQQLLEAGNKKMLTVARSVYYPQINAFFNYNTFYTSFDDRRINEQLFQIYPQRTLGLSLTIPIFNNFENRLSVTRSKVEYQNQQLEKSALERRISQEVKLAYENYKASIKREEATKLQLTAAEEAQVAISERFRLGVSNFVDLSQANQQLVTGQSDYAQSLYTLYFQEIILKYALGVLEVN
ncbi:TolC family protein [Rhodonellum sp.]|uniref:TolC family protein n=1 Tax=Rhodonellum sp. TaxID=2231180 RepID=UPI00271ADDC4|nr:TolC family protein [Rhodonellum sp.]MDO9554106.1 TolC family protein [Rhodonellum sp.]